MSTYGDCIGCGLCTLGCPAFEETAWDVLTAKGRNKALQAGLRAADMKESIDACTMCGYCDGICPTHVRNVETVLALRRELHGTPAAPAVLKANHVVLGCTLRERAAHLIPGIQAFLRKAGRSADILDEGCCGSLEVESGHANPSKSTAGVVCDPVCMEQVEGEFLGELAMRRLELFDFGRSVYYFVPHRLVNRQHARFYPAYHAMRVKLRCETNLDLNRLARSTTMGSVQGLTGRDSRDVRLLVGRLLEQVKAERIVTCSPADYLAFRQFSNRDVKFVTECLK